MHPCLGCVTAGRSSWELPLPALDDAEGASVAPDLPFVVDAHVHLFPKPLFEAIWRWFDEFGWVIRYKLEPSAVVDYLLTRGIGHVVTLAYAHKPGMARALNAFMADAVRGRPQATGLATVYPGEPDARAILEEGFAAGLAGVKLHCHVQCFSPDAPELREIYETCIRHDKPLLMHAGREPKSPGYKCDPHLLCHADRVDAVMRRHPELRLAVPHLGADELDGYAALLERHENLWLDTTMVLAGFFDDSERAFEIVERHGDRIMFGTDFPNIPYAWDRELRRVAARGLDDDTLEAVLGGNARRFYRLAVD